MIGQALDLMFEAHRNDIRKNLNIPYIIHPLEVMKTLRSWGVTDVDILDASLDHDIIEDHPEYRERLKEAISVRAFQIVEELTKPKDLKTLREKVIYFRHFERSSIESLLIKVSDRLCNIWDFYRFGDKDYAIIYAMKGVYIFKSFFDRIEEVPIDIDHIVLDIEDMDREVLLDTGLSYFNEDFESAILSYLDGS